MPVNMSTFWSDLGIVSGNTNATNQYELYKGLTFDDGFVCASQYDFFTHLGTNKYEFFKSYNSVDSNIVDEYTFYKNTSDPNIYDFRTFNSLAGSFISSTPVTPTPTPSVTPTSTVTPTPTVTPTSTVTPTPTPSPVVPTMTFITSTGNTSNLSTYTFTDVSIGGPGLIVVVYASEGNNASPSSFTSFQIGGSEATIVKQQNSVSGTDGNTAMAYRRITGGTTTTISITLSQSQQRAAIGIWRIQNNVSDTPITSATGFTTTSVSGTTTLNSLTNGDFVISSALNGLAGNLTWTNATQRFEQNPENLIFFEGADATKSGDGNLTITAVAPATPTQGLYTISAAWR